MNVRKLGGRGLRSSLAVGVLLGVCLAGYYAPAALAQTTSASSSGSGSSKEKQPSEPVKITLQFLRTDTANTADTTGTTLTVGTPILTTLDGSTATIAITGDDLSYTLGFSPKIESHGKMVQILWSIRISGKSLPGGATGMTMTGASQVSPDAQAGIAEISVSDPVTGRKSVFRLQGVTTIGDAAGTVSVQTAPTPANVTAPAG